MGLIWQRPESLDPQRYFGYGFDFVGVALALVSVLLSRRYSLSLTITSLH
jgi:hypothetical protein